MNKRENNCGTTSSPELEETPGGPRPAFDRFATTAAAALLLGLASYYLMVFLILASMRLGYPFELECMEAEAVVQVQRILDGLPVYDKPSLDYTAGIYTPLYFYVSALPALVVGNGFLALRLVSFIATLGSFGFVFLIVRRRTASLFASFTAAGLLAAAFSISGAWFDVARVDSLLLLCLMAGVYAFDSPRVLVRSVVSPALFFLAYFTKQPVLVVAVALSASALLTRKRLERVAFPLVFGVLFLGSWLIMHLQTAGWYDFYVFSLPRQHAFEKDQVVEFWTSDLARRVAVELSFCLVPLLGIFRRHAKNLQSVHDALLLGSLFLASYLMRLHSGGYDNVLMPAYGGVAIYAGVGFGLAMKEFGPGSRARLALILVVALQFAGLFYWPQAQIPSLANRRQGEALLQRIGRYQGEVLWAGHPWYLHMLGKPMQAHDMAIHDILRASRADLWKRKLTDEMQAAVAAGKYEAIVVDFNPFFLKPSDFDKYYELADSNVNGGVFRVATGWDRTPTYLYVRRSGAQKPPQ